MKTEELTGDLRWIKRRREIRKATWLKAHVQTARDALNNLPK